MSQIYTDDSKTLSLRPMISVLLMGMLVLSAVFCPWTLQASSYPERVISLIVPANPGGGFDTQARILVPTLKTYLPKRVDVVVQNVPGAAMRVGSLRVLESNPDGYTIGLLDNASLAIAQAMGQLKGRDIRKDLTWLGRTEAPGQLLALSKKSALKSLQDFKGKPIKVGVTSQEAVAAILLVQALGGMPYIILYDGIPEAVLACRRGDVDAVLSSFSSGVKNVNSSEGEIIALLSGRLDKRPEVPNVPNLVDIKQESLISVMGGDRLLAAPAGLPKNVESILMNAVFQATTDDTFVSQMKKGGYLPSGGIKSDEIIKLVSAMLDAVTKSKDVWGPILIK